MIRMRAVVLICIILPMTLISGVSLAGEPLDVWVSILPQKYFAEKVAGGLARVSVMVPPGSNPATYEPKPAQMRRMARSKIFFSIGVPFEKMWLKRVAAVNPEMQVAQTDSGIDKREMSTGDYRGKRNLPGKTQSGDPHIWLSPPLVKTQARAMADALIRIDPAHKRTYEINLKKFETEIDRLDLELKKIFEQNPHGAEFLVFHPSWGYFADTYGLKQISVETEGKAPSAAEMAGLIRYCRDRGIRVVFVQPQFSARRAKTIAREIGGQVVFIDPLNKNWAKNLRSVAAKVAAALR